MIASPLWASLAVYVDSRFLPSPCDDAEAIYTDEWRGYDGIGDENTRHETIRHGDEEWVNGQIHTNTVESVWSLFDRSVIGAYPQALRQASARVPGRSRVPLEQPRQRAFLFRDTILRLVEADTLTYEGLVRPS